MYRWFTKETYWWITRGWMFFFYPTKNLTTGEGGMVTSNSLKNDKKEKLYLAHGIKSSAFDRSKKNKLV